MAKRAYGIEDKQLRHKAIVESARGLFAAGAGGLPSVGHIADAAGLAKGTVYLYFRTKEAIFANLLLAGWGDVLSEIDDAVAGRGRREAKVAALIDRFSAYLDRHPELLRLDALGHEIERNLDDEAFRAFKDALNDRIARSGRIVEQALRLPDGRGLELLMRTYAFTRGLWLSIDGEPVTVGRPVHPFRTELAEALADYWRGALSARPGAEGGR